MKELKFRAWDKWKNKMIAPHDGDFIRWHAMFNWRDCLEVMQWTGLRDVNGKEMYEGDILRYRDPLADNYREYLIGQINWYKSTAGLVIQELKENARGGHYKTSWDFVVDPEVIGNIYENPELLES